MIHHNKIKAYARRVAREFEPEKIILFGSYAYGNPTEDSDVDLLVVMQYEEGKERKSLEIRRKIRAGFPMDLITRTPGKIKERLEMNDCFIKEIMEKGKVLYEAGNDGVGRLGQR